jgi:phage-related protein
MKLVRLAKARWEVLALCDGQGRCQVLDFLGDLKGSYAAAASSMLVLLLETVPKGGPPRFEPRCKHLGNGLYEFRKQPKGKKLRVVWFYGGGSVIVCTAAFKKAERTPRTEIDRARLLQERYRLARARGAIEILDLEGQGGL